MRLTVHDPGYDGLRKAIRGALTVPIVLVVGDAVGNVDAELFAFFGVFGLLIFGDFLGPPRQRAAAYAVVTVIGVPLVTLGTLVSGDAWLGLVVTLAVVFVIEIAGVFGGYAAAAGMPLVLAFVLAACFEGTASDVPARVAGWAAGGAVALVAAVGIWPRYPRTLLAERLADAARALAALVETRRDGERGAIAAALARADDAVGVARSAYDDAPFRPTGPTARDRALFTLVVTSARILDLSSPSWPGAGTWTSARDRVLADALAAVLRAGALVLVERQAPLPDLEALHLAREAHRHDLEEHAGSELRHGAAPAAVLTGLGHSFSLRIASTQALVFGANAVVSAGRDLEVDEIDEAVLVYHPGPRAWLTRVVTTLRAHLQPRSIWFQNALRAALGLALGVFVTGIARIDHAFWVVLGTLSVLRSSALGTGRTALQALTGTLVGFLVAVAFTEIVGDDRTALWVAFPILAALSGYAPTAISFAVGQAAFTVFIVSVFNFLEPTGWQTALARLEDIAIGVGVATGVGLVLWPRGARGHVRAALGEAYERVAAYVRAALDRAITGGAALPRAATAAAIDAVERASEAVTFYRSEPGAQTLAPSRCSELLSGAGAMQFTGDLLLRIVDMGWSAAGCGEGVTALEGEKSLVVAEMQRTAQVIRGDATDTGPRDADGDSWRDAAVRCLGEWGGADRPPAGHAAIGVVWVGEWVTELHSALEHLAPAAAEVGAVDIGRWWR